MPWLEHWVCEPAGSACIGAAFMLTVACSFPTCTDGHGHHMTALHGCLWQPLASAVHSRALAEACSM